MNNYESPVIQFEELTFFEKIAETCWGSKSVTFDYPYDNKYDPIPSPLILSKGCGGDKDPKSSVLCWLEGILTKEEFAYWQKSDDNNSNNLANTKSKGFNFDHKS